MTYTSFDPSPRSPVRVAAPLESPSQLAIIGMVVWLIGAVVHPLALLAPIGLLLLLLAGVAYLIRPKRRSMYWRGRNIDLDSANGPLDRLYLSIFKR